MPALALPIQLLALSPLLQTPATQQAGEYRPFVAEASAEGEQALARFTLPEGFRATLWASEPMLANPVTLAFDERGRCYVAETFRHHAGVTDIRDHMDWLDDDLASQTVEDRVAMIRRHTGEGFADYEREQERVRRIEDTDGDGRADRASVFAAGFDEAAAGIGAGLLARGREVYYACIPELWHLVDEDDDGVAEKREVLSAGYGVNVALLGHDLHGLRIGPDGRLYFSIGDRGFQVQTKEGAVLASPKTGAVLRCDLDGSNLEVYASGLRNPQELVFDDRGDLFTGDNNSDGGDRARFVWVLEGGDSGWRYPYQWITEPDLRGPWNAEALWHPSHPGQPAYIVPPIDNLADGPSGLAYMPGNAWGEEWRDTFFLCDFRGTPSSSGVHAFRLQPSGAGYALSGARQFFWGCLATDADFGPDGALYVSDWVDGWNMTGKGRIYRVAPSGGIAPEAAGEVARLVSGGLVGLDAYQLHPYLAHPDQRVRLAAQFELVRRSLPKDDSEREYFIGHLRDAALLGKSLVERLHGIWGLGQLARTDSRTPAMLFGLLQDPEPEVRAQALRVIGEARYGFSGVKAMLADPEPRVRLFAAQALGHYGTLHAVPPLIELLRANADADPWIRHACVRSLERLKQRAELLAHADDESAAVRRGVLLVLRRWKDAEIARYLADEDPALVAEAARAIHDVPIDAAWDALASMLDTCTTTGDDYLLRRLVNANLREGDEGARRIARFVERRKGSERVLAEAVEVLASWDAPAPRDRVTGFWRPFEGERSLAPIAPLTGELAPAVLACGSPRMLCSWLGLARRTLSGEQLECVRGLLAEERVDESVRAAALDCLLALEPANARELLRQTTHDSSSALRAAAFSHVAALPPAQALELVDGALAEESLAVRRAGIMALASIPGDAADQRILGSLAALQAGHWPAELELDLLETAGARDAAPVREALEACTRAREQATPLGAALACANGGDAERGRRIFFEDARVTCLRCHRVGDQGGTEIGGQVGPELTQVGSRRSRVEILESVLRPNAAMAEGFENWVLVLDDDTSVAGKIESEDGEVVRVVTAGQEHVEVDASRIAARRRDLSAMPEDLAEKISRHELRDLVEYLASLR
jgi:quinoprotein glucose dehydrogenase